MDQPQLMDVMAAMETLKQEVREEQRKTSERMDKGFAEVARLIRQQHAK